MTREIYFPYLSLLSEAERAFVESCLDDCVLVDDESSTVGRSDLSASIEGLISGVESLTVASSAPSASVERLSSNIGRLDPIVVLATLQDTCGCSSIPDPVEQSECFENCRAAARLRIRGALR